MSVDYDEEFHLAESLEGIEVDTSLLLRGGFEKQYALARKSNGAGAELVVPRFVRCLVSACWPASSMKRRLRSTYHTAGSNADRFRSRV